MSRRWWEQDGLDMEGTKKRAAAAAESDREEKIGEEEGIVVTGGTNYTLN